MAVKFRSDWGQDLWDTMKPRDDWYASQVDVAVDRLRKSKARYQTIETATGVPWFWIAGAHWREINGDFSGVLHNGQKIIGTGKKTTLVPKGRGPFWSWEESAIDALRLQDLEKIDDPQKPGIEWTLNRILYEWERYNGFGYLGKVNSPYVWSYSNHYGEPPKIGKYVSDGVYDPNHEDKQIGTAMILQRLMLKDEEVAEYIETGATKPTPTEPDPFARLHALLDDLESLGFRASLERITKPN